MFLFRILALGCVSAAKICARVFTTVGCGFIPSGVHKPLSGGPIQVFSGNIGIASMDAPQLQSLRASLITGVASSGKTEIGDRDPRGTFPLMVQPRSDKICRCMGCGRQVHPCETIGGEWFCLVCVPAARQQYEYHALRLGVPVERELITNTEVLGNTISVTFVDREALERWLAGLKTMRIKAEFYDYEHAYPEAQKESRRCQDPFREPADYNY